jgi:hypothetical protein
MATSGPYIPPGLCPRPATAVPAGHSYSSFRLGTLERFGLGPTVAHELLQYHGTTSTPNSVNGWVVDFGASNHTTPSVDNISNHHPLNSASPSSIIVGNGFTLPVTSVGDSVIAGLFYLNNILLAPNIVQSLPFVHHFTIDNWCFMEFSPFGLFVKDLITRNVIARSNSTSPMYTLRLSRSNASSRILSCVMSVVAAPRILDAIATSTWHRHLGHPGPDALSSLSRLSFISCTSTTHDFCHACQLDKHTRLPFSSSSSCAEFFFDLMHLDLWTSLVVVCLVLNITWSFLMVSLIICGPFRLN